VLILNFNLKMKNINIEIQKTNKFIMAKFNIKTDDFKFGILGIGIYLEFVFWSLGF